MDDILEQGYDPLLSKFCSSLLWFVCRLSENGITDIPAEITNPLEPTATDTVLVRPTVIDYLTSGSMYLNVSKTLYDTPLYSLWDLIQRFSQHGVYVMDEKDEAVTDQDLTEKFPFKISSHLALMDAIMLIYSNNIVNVQMIVNAVRSFSTFNASKELPFDLEDALLLWLNKINQINTAEYCNSHVAPSSHGNDGSKQQKYRFRRDQLVEKKIFPVLTDISDCFKDGITPLSLMLFYYPAQLSIDGVHLSSQLSIDERLSNIETFRSLCADHVCTSVFALPTEDFFHAREEFKQNFVALLCEIFVQLDTVRKKLLDSQVKDDSSHQNARLDEASSHQMQAKGVPDPGKPLLTKRSKRHLSTLDQQEDQRSSALQLDDLELKQSHIIPSTYSHGHLQNASQAWEGGNEVEKKQAKISLDFRPDSGSSFRSTVQCTSSSDSNPLISSTDTYIVNQNVSPPETSLTQSMNKNGRNYSDGKNIVDKSDSRVDPFLASPAQPPNRTVTPYTPHEKYVDDQPTSSSICTVSSLSTSQEITDSSFNQAKPPLSDRDNEFVDEDALSTITEATEPDTPSLYSFHSSSASTINDSGDERFFLNAAAESGSGFFIDDFDHKVYPGHIKIPGQHHGLSYVSNTPNNERLHSHSHTVQSSNEFDKTLTEEKIAKVNDQSDLQDGNTNRSSYTVTASDEEIAIANGLPVITSARHSDTVHNRSDTNKFTAGLTPNINVQPLVDSQSDHRLSSSDANSDFEEGPINLRFPSQNSLYSLGTYSSSSGISEDDGRFNAVAEEHGRPSHVIYSSLSEHSPSPHPLNCENKENEVFTDFTGNTEVRRVHSQTNRETEINENHLKNANLHEEESQMKEGSNVSLKEKSICFGKAFYGAWPFVENNNYMTKYDNFQNISKGFHSEMPVSVTTSWFEIFTKDKKRFNVEEEFKKLQLRKKKYKSCTRNWTDFVHHKNLNDDLGNPIFTAMLVNLFPVSVLPKLIFLPSQLLT